MRGVQAGEGGNVRGLGLLHRDRQVAGRGLSEGQAGTLRQWQIAGGLHRGLAAAVERHFEQELEDLVVLLERQDLRIGTFARRDQAIHGREQLEQLATDLLARRNRRGGGQWKNVDLTGHQVTPCRNCPL
ncbi:hypothetical protein D3C85_834810 [compost metagenome]